MNKVYAIIGPPASGKSSILKRLLDHGGVVALVSHTTRPPQADDCEGKNYYFVSKEEFQKLNLLEKVSYSGHYYGLSKDEVFKKVNQYPISIIDVDFAGFEQLKKQLGDRIESICILVDKDSILTRFISQGRDAADIKKRIEYAEQQGEFNNWQIADHVVKNTGGLDVSVRQVMAIMNLL